MDTLDLLISDLKSINISENPNKFDDLLGKISDLNNEKMIMKLSYFFNDNSEYDEIMFSIIHTIEAFDDETYICEILKAIPHLSTNSPSWASIILVRILNSEPTKIEMIKQLINASNEVKTSLRNLVERINIESPDLIQKTISISPFIL